MIKSYKNKLIFTVISMLLTNSICALAADYSPATSQTADYKRPKPQFLRYNQDWSSLKDVDRDKLLPQDKIKYVKLSDDGNVWVSFGGHLRARLESHDEFAFGAPANNDDEFFLYRGLFHADFHFGESFRVFTEFKHADSSSRNLPGGNRNIDVDKTEIQQFFVDYKIPLSEADQSLTFRFGRQEYGFARNRLVSPLPWANSLRHWDGFNINYKTSNLDVTAFYSHFVPVRQDRSNRPDADNLLHGIYITQTLSAKKGFDYYWLGTDRENRSFNGTFGDESRETFGLRHWGKFNDEWSYEFETAYQTGSVGSEDVSAFMLASEFVYKPKNVKFSPKLTLGYDYASGDDDVGGEVNTFNQLFPLGHAYFGFIDIIGRQNIVDFSSSITINPAKKTSVRLAIHILQRAERADALYNAGGGVVRAGGVNASKDVGTEFDLTFSYKLSKRTGLSFGVSRLIAGDFLSDTGSDEDINFAYAQLLFTF